MGVIFTIIICWFLADWLTGIIHWWEDRYLTLNSKGFLKSLAQDNINHHNDPELMGKSTWWENMNTSAPYAWVLVAVVYFLGAPMIVWLTFFFASFGNLVHRFAHVPKNKIPKPVRYLQKWGIFISTKHHNQHHRYRGKVIDKEDTFEKYCPMTNLMNPILDYFKFFPRLEYLLSKLGIHPIF